MAWLAGERERAWERERGLANVYSSLSLSQPLLFFCFFLSGWFFGFLGVNGFGFVSVSLLSLSGSVVKPPRVGGSPTECGWACLYIQICQKGWCYNQSYGSVGAWL